MKPDIEDGPNVEPDESAIRKAAKDLGMERKKRVEDDPGSEPSLEGNAAAPTKTIFKSDFRLSFASVSSDAKTILNLLTMSPNEVKTVIGLTTGQGNAELMSLWSRIGRRTFCLPNYEAIVKTTTLKEYYEAAGPLYGESEIKRTRNETPTVTIFLRPKKDTPTAKDTTPVDLSNLASVGDKVCFSPSPL